MEHLKDWLPSVTEIIKASFWPLVVTGFLFGFRKQIGVLLERLKSVGTSGAEFNPAQKEAIENQKRQSAESVITGSEIALSGSKPKEESVSLKPETKPVSTEVNAEFEKEKAGLSVSPLIREQAEAISKQIETSAYNPEQIKTIGVLLLAKALVVADFWRIYNFIFGSQLYMLQQLNIVHWKEVDLIYHIANLKEKFPEAHKDRTGQAYIQYLIANVLIKEEKDDEGKVTYHLTVKGKEFLFWCVESSLSFNKPF